MAWKFWKSGEDKSDAELSLEKLRAGQATSGVIGPTPDTDPSLPDTGFRMRLEDVSEITARGAVATGVVIGGQVTIHQTVVYTDVAGRPRRATVIGIEALGARVDRAGEGDRVGVLLRGVLKERVAVDGGLWG